MPLSITYVYRVDLEKFCNYIGKQYIFIKAKDINSHGISDSNAFLGKITKIQKEKDDVIKGKHLKITLKEEPFDSVAKNVNLHLYGEYAKRAKILENDLFAVSNVPARLQTANCDSNPQLHFYELIAQHHNDENQDAIIWIMSTSLPGSQKSYEYDYKLSLELSQNIDKKVNFFGIVTRVNEIKKTRGSSFHCGIAIIDSLTEELDDQDDIHVNIFFHPGNIFPKILHGHIIRIHRAKVSNFDNSINLVVYTEKDFALWSNKLGDTMEPISASNSYTFTDSDRQVIHSMRLWWANKYPFRADYLKCVAEGTTRDFREISDAVGDKYINLICQVIGIHQISENLSYLRLWDGSKPAKQIFRFPLFNVLSRKDSERQRILRDYLVDIEIHDKFVNEINKFTPKDMVIIKYIRCVSSDRCWKFIYSDEFPICPRIELFEANKATYYIDLLKEKMEELGGNWSSTSAESPSKRFCPNNRNYRLSAGSDKTNGEYRIRPLTNGHNDKHMFKYPVNRKGTNGYHLIKSESLTVTSSYHGKNHIDSPVSSHAHSSTTEFQHNCKDLDLSAPYSVIHPHKSKQSLLRSFHQDSVATLCNAYSSVNSPIITSPIIVHSLIFRSANWQKNNLQNHDSDNCLNNLLTMDDNDFEHIAPCSPPKQNHFKTKNQLHVNGNHKSSVLIKTEIDNHLSKENVQTISIAHLKGKPNLTKELLRIKIVDYIPKVLTHLNIVNVECVQCLYRPHNEADKMQLLYGDEGCPQCSRNKDSVLISFSLVLIVYDGKDTLYVNLKDEHAELFFEKLAVQEYIADEKLLENPIQRILKKLCPHRGVPNSWNTCPNPPITIEVFPYKVHNQTLYGLCHTTLK